jgi:hypothetical protein
MTPETKKMYPKILRHLAWDLTVSYFSAKIDCGIKAGEAEPWFTPAEEKVGTV